jgi:hypothetical protein
MFARDFYTLRYHVDFMRNKLQGIKAEKKKAPPPAA